MSGHEILDLLWYNEGCFKIVMTPWVLYRVFADEERDDRGILLKNSYLPYDGLLIKFYKTFTVYLNECSEIQMTPL